MDEAAARSFEDTLARRWKVFVSSTTVGLRGFRDVARDVIRDFTYAGMRCFEPVMMEDFGARDGPAREVCAQKVLDCDVLVGIIGMRYGAHPADDQTSYTELEFQAAVDHDLSRLMFLLEEKAALRLERASPQGDDRADRQEQFRRRVGTDLVAEMTVRTRKDFGQKLTRALEEWVTESSYKRALVDHSTQFQEARRRLLSRGEWAGGATLIFGEPGTGKTRLLNALVDDVPVRRAYGRLIGPLAVWLAEGKEAVEQVRAQVESTLGDFAGQRAGGSVAALPPVLIALQLESDINAGRDVDPHTLSALPRLFAWDAPRAVVLAETNNRQVMERLEDDLGWSSDGVITVSDYASIGDALEQMRRDAPGVRDWPQPDTRILAEALGMRPISLFAAAKDIEREARRSPHRVPAKIRQQLDAIAGEQSPAGKYRALLRSSIDRLSPRARELLALMTVLHPKPTHFRDEITAALDLSLDLDEAVSIATAEDDGELDANGRRHRDTAYELVGELVDRGLLERVPGNGDGGEDSPELLTLHPANVRVIRDYLPLTDEQRAQGHARAEAFYRARVGQAISGSFDSRFRMENEAWWDDAEEWLYHFSHIAPDQAAISYATLFLDAYWWWDLYVRWEFCDRLLDYAARPRVQAISADMPEVTRLLTRFRETYPREYEATLAQVYAEIAGDDPARAAAVRQTASTGAGVIPILKDLCGRLGITELDALFTGTTPEASAPAPALAPNQARLHLLGLICLFLAEGHRFRDAAEPGEPGKAALAAADACYRRAESYFLDEDDAFDLAWTRYQLGEVISLLGRDPAQVWEEAADSADEESDVGLLANIERARGDHLRDHGDLEGALRRYGRSVFYGAAQQVNSNVQNGADAYTQAFYWEIRLHATKILAQPLFDGSASSPDSCLAEARRRLDVMLGEWGGSWRPEPAKLDRVLRSASREALEESVRAIANAAFPPGPGDAVLGRPGSRYYRQIDDLIEKTRAQPWVRGLGRWTGHRGPQEENP